MSVFILKNENIYTTVLPRPPPYIGNIPKLTTASHGTPDGRHPSFSTQIFFSMLLKRLVKELVDKCPFILCVLYLRPSLLPLPNANGQWSNSALSSHQRIDLIKHLLFYYPIKTTLLYSLPKSIYISPLYKPKPNNM